MQNKFEMCKVICNYLHFNAGNASGSGLPQFLPACSTFSSLLIILTCKTKTTTLHYTPKTPHYTLTIYSKHALSHKSLNSQNSLSITVTAAVTLSPSPLPQLPRVPQQPSHVICHIILWLVAVVLFSTNRNTFFFACKHFLLADTFVTKAHFYCFFLHQKQSKRDGIIYRKYGFGHAGASVESGGGVWGWACSKLHKNIHRFWFQFVVLVYPDLLRPEQTRPDSFSLINPQQ